MNRRFKLDDKDRMIISLLSKNPEMSQSDIARVVGISQPSVGIRLKRLQKEGTISIVAGIDFKKIKLYLAKVEMEAKNTVEIIEKFKNCPYFVNAFITSGKKNLCIFFMSEDIATLDALVDRNLRGNPNIKNVEMNLVVTPISSFVLPIKMKIEKRDVAPCNLGVDCRECIYYKEHRCLGCPALGHYRGNFWKVE